MPEMWPLLDEASRYRLLAENASDVVALGDNAGVLSWVSNSVTALLGWSSADLVGRPFTDVVHPDDLPAIAALRQVVMAGEPGRADVRMRTLDGGFRWVGIALKPVFDESGAVVGRVAAWRDAQSEHEALEALTAAERRFRWIAENSSDIVLIADTDRVITWVSPSITKVLGWEPKALVGHQATDFLHPEDLATAAAARAALTETEPVRARARVRTATGEYRWIESMAQVVHDETGKPSEIVGSWRDVNEEQLSQQALQASELRFRLLAENAADVVYLLGADRLVSWISDNVETTLGWRAEELVGSSMYDLVHPDDRGTVDEARDAMFAGDSFENPAQGFEIRFRCRDDSYRWMSVRATAITGPDGALASAVMGMRDVDDLVRERHVAEYEAARRQAIVESLLDPHVLLQAVRDDAGVVVDFIYADANAAACEYNHVTHEQLIGTRLLDLLPGQAGSGMLAMYANAVESNRPLVLNDYAYPHEILASERRYDIRAVRVGDALSFTWRDVTDRYEAARLVSESEERYRVLAENTGDIVIRSRNHVMIWASPSLTTVLGWQPEEWVGHLLDDFVNPDDDPRLQQGRTQIYGGSPDVFTMRVRAKDGKDHWVELRGAPFTNADGEVDGAVGSIRVIDDEVAARQELEHMAQFDMLTGVLNRKEILHKLSGMSAGARRPGQQTAVLFCDIDRFKEINDTYGHAAGDEVLRTLAERINAAIRDEDYVARIGGDELLVVLTAVHSLEDAAAVAEKIRNAASVSIGLEHARITTTLSIGVTLMRIGETVDDMVARADAAMYAAKKQGRNQVVAIDAVP